MLGLNKKDTSLLIIVAVLTMLAPFILNPFPEGSELAQFNAGYPDLMQRFVIFGIFAIGFNILFGLTGIPVLRSRGLPGRRILCRDLDDETSDAQRDPRDHHGHHLCRDLRHVAVGYVSLRRSGIYFSILTLAFAQMSYALAYSVLTPITGGETGLQIKSTDTPLLSNLAPGEIGRANLFGLEMGSSYIMNVGGWQFTFNAGYYIAASRDADRLLPVDPHLPLALRHDAAGGEVEPAADELYRPELASPIRWRPS